MKAINCLVVDDEALARKLLENYISKIPDLQLISKCENALEAKQILQNQPIDLLFLDIQMPDLTGIDFLQSLRQRPMSILTTAYAEYALKGYELDVIDYLLKPFPFERFFQAVEKAKELIQLKRGTDIPKDNLTEESLENEKKIWSTKEYFFVKADSKIVKILFSEINYIEGMREYVRIHTDTQKIIPLLSLQKLVDILPSEQFFRIHRSYIINLQKIQEMQNNLVVVADTALTISKSQRNAFHQWVKERGLF